MKKMLMKMTNPNDPMHEAQRLSRLGLKWLGIGLGGFLLWAALAPLDEGVPTPGQVAIDSKRKTIQHLQGGIVKKVHVREGQMVKEGDLLLELDEATVRAQREQAAQNLAGLRENVVAQQALLKGLTTAEQNRAEQRRLIEQELEGLRGLVKDGFAPKVQQLQLERSLADIQTAQTDLQTNRQRTQQAILELQHQLKAAEQRLTAAQQDLERLEIRAGVSGQVVGLQLQGDGSVIQPAQRLMDIVPDEQQLIIEARIPPQYIDRLQEGQAVNARFSNFKQSLQVVAPAKLVSISGDVLTDTNTGEGYYLARVALTPEGLNALAGRSMQPGMPVEVVVLTGSRSLLQYLLHPLTRRIAASLKEE